MGGPKNCTWIPPRLLSCTQWDQSCFQVSSEFLCSKFFFRYFRKIQSLFRVKCIVWNQMKMGLQKVVCIGGSLMSLADNNNMYRISANSYLPWIVVAEKYVLCMWILRQIFEIFFNLQIQKTIVVGNTEIR